MTDSVEIITTREVKENWISDFLFHDSAYLNLFSGSAETYIAKSQRSCLAIQFRTQDAVATSPASASFGGPVLAAGDLMLPELQSFLSGVEDKLRTKNIQHVVIRTMPRIYWEEYIQMVSDAFYEYGYTRKNTDTNQHIDIKAEFEQHIRYNELKKLRQSEAGMEFRQLDRSWLSSVYDVVHLNRKWKGYPMSMTLDQLALMFDQFPARYRLFGVFKNQQLVAAAVSIKINGDILYNFYHGDIAETRSKSPVVLLVKGIYNYALQRGFSILDLGISSVESKLNDGLYTFKKNLGAEESERITWEKLL